MRRNSDSDGGFDFVWFCVVLVWFCVGWCGSRVVLCVGWCGSWVLLDPCEAGDLLTASLLYLGGSEVSKRRTGSSADESFLVCWLVCVRDSHVFLLYQLGVTVDTTAPASMDVCLLFEGKTCMLMTSVFLTAAWLARNT